MCIRDSLKDVQCNVDMLDQDPSDDRTAVPDRYAKELPTNSLPSKVPQSFVHGSQGAAKTQQWLYCSEEYPQDSRC